MFRYIENISTDYDTGPSQEEFSGAVSATLCSGTPSCGRGPRTQGLHESQKASGRQGPGPGFVESVGEEEEGEVEAVLSAEGLGGTRMGALRGWRRRPGASTPVEKLLRSESGGAASRSWSRVRGEVEEGAEEG